MEQICEAQLISECKMTKNWQVKNFNNNTGEDVCREVNGCQNKKPVEIQQIAVKNDAFENINENLDLARAADINSESFHKIGLLSPNSNETSANNSTDNLSYFSDNCLVEESFIVPHNLSDEEISINSDDCVYAYRGADFDALEQRNNQHEDETDFLEMDFDPDPTSEIDHVDETHTFDTAKDFIKPNTESPVKNFELKIDEKMKMRSTEVAVKGTTAEFVFKDNTGSDAIVIDETLTLKTKPTGTKPKKGVNVEKNIKSPKSSKCRQPIQPFFNQSSRPICIEKDPDDTCLDCLEKDFLLKTIGKKLDSSVCTKCQANQCQSVFTSSQISISADATFSVPFVTKEYANLNKIYQSTVCDNIVEENLLNQVSKENVTIFSINVDEKTIVQALEKIDACFDKEVIRNYFDSIPSTFDDVTDLIVHISKKNCDYKRIVKLISQASQDRLKITFTPDENVKILEEVEVSSYDILQSFNRKNDLTRLKRLDRRFLQMNILGKVINVLRQAQQRQGKLLSEVINIPQYYKAGYITINKI